jgi:hypothetical protein
MDTFEQQQQQQQQQQRRKVSDTRRSTEQGFVCFTGIAAAVFWF